MSSQISYFAAGPAKLPKEALETLQKEFIHYENTGVSVMELSHRSADFAGIIEKTEALIRELLTIPDNYKVMFFQGGGVGQFAAIPLNLISRSGEADYIVTGSWSAKASKEAEKYGKVNLVLPKTSRYTQIPPSDQWTFSSNPAYVYYCANETVDGVEFQSIPKVPEGVPLVCDMSSNICSRPVDVSKYGVIVAGAQKNIGCAGVTLVIVRDDLLGSAMKVCPSVLDFTSMAKAKSLQNTPPTFAVHVMRRCLEWVKEHGAVDGMEKRSVKKSNLLYNLIDSSEGLYSCQVKQNCRSRMNVVFRVGGENGNETLEKAFLEGATKCGLLALKGHRSVGGIRASIYNAVTLEDVERLVEYMKEFADSQKIQ